MRIDWHEIGEMRGKWSSWDEPQKTNMLRDRNTFKDQPDIVFESFENENHVFPSHLRCPNTSDPPFRPRLGTSQGTPLYRWGTFSGLMELVDMRHVTKWYLDVYPTKWVMAPNMNGHIPYIIWEETGYYPLTGMQTPQPQSRLWSEVSSPCHGRVNSTLCCESLHPTPQMVNLVTYVY